MYHIYHISKSLPPLTVYCTNVRGLRGNFTDLEAFMLKNKPDIFALCETNLHGDIQNSDFQLHGYLPIHCKDVGHMQSICRALVFTLRAIFQLLEDENESCICFHFALLHSTTWYVVTSMPITLSGLVIPIPLMLQVFCKLFKIQHALFILYL